MWKKPAAEASPITVQSEYYNHRYSGMLGKCMHYMVDFPLE